MIPCTNELALHVSQVATEEEWGVKSARDGLIRKRELSIENLQEKTRGGNNLFDDHFRWARHDLKRVGWIKQTRRGYFVATGQGENVLVSKPERLDILYALGKHVIGRRIRPSAKFSD